MHTTLRPVGGATSWTAASLEDPAWRLTATPDWPETALAIADDLSRVGVTLDNATPAHFVGYPGLDAAARALDDRVREGPGFAIMSGAPVDALGDDAAALVYWGLGTRLGRTREQSATGKRIHRVENQDGDKSPGGSTSNKRITLHTENARPPHPPRLLSLLCLRRAADGGASLLASGHTVHDKLLEEDPAAATRMYAESNFGRQPEVFADGRTFDRDQVFSPDGERLRVRYSRYWLDRGVEASGEPFDDDLKRGIEHIDQLLEDDAIVIDPVLEPGDLLLVDNTVVMHGRAAFEDGPSRRCLLRLWVD